MRAQEAWGALGWARGTCCRRSRLGGQGLAALRAVVRQHQTVDKVWDLPQRRGEWPPARLSLRSRCGAGWWRRRPFRWPLRGKTLFPHCPVVIHQAGHCHFAMQERSLAKFAATEPCLLALRHEDLRPELVIWMHLGPERAHVEV